MDRSAASGRRLAFIALTLPLLLITTACGAPPSPPGARPVRGDAAGVLHTFELSGDLETFDDWEDVPGAAVFSSPGLVGVRIRASTPINGITGMAQMLRDAHLQPPFDRYLSAMQKSCNHLVGVVDDVLDEFVNADSMEP